MSEKILGIKVTTKSKKEILQELEKDIKNNKRNILFNANPLIICNFYRDKKMVNEINKENLNIPDGFGTVLASKLKHGQIKERIAGIDLFDELCKLSLKTKSKIFIYGAKEENLDLAIKNIEKKYRLIILILSISYISTCLVVCLPRPKDLLISSVLIFRLPNLLINVLLPAPVCPVTQVSLPSKKTFNLSNSVL